MGVAMYPDDGLEAVAPMKHADTAMYQAKQPGKNNFRFFNNAASIELNSEEHVNLPDGQNEPGPVY